MKRVIVNWDDAWASQEDYTVDEARKFTPHPTKSIGFLVKHGDGVCVLAQSKDEAGISEVLVIPEGMVTRVQELG
jgi:hypothetical protein